MLIDIWRKSDVIDDEDMHSMDFADSNTTNQDDTTPLLDLMEKAFAGQTSFNKS